MPTLKAGMPNNRHPERGGGFTLVELLVVMFIISLFTAFTLPRLADIGELRLNGAARHLGRTITYLYAEAVSSRKVVRLYVDMDKGKYYPATMNSKGEFEKTSFPLFTSGSLGAGLEVKSFVTVFSGAFGGNMAYLHLMPEGFAEKTVIVLGDESGRLVSLIVDPLTGGVRVEPGKVGIDYEAGAA
ncbi:MAG: prepilin-type N-terminal cleavage/methylation domain-containing protein [Nitrospinae bacterium]|nr:prepilin-type N-terminal cleavage/methylation domain-containing protein [Nitrospinota bacterium]